MRGQSNSVLGGVWPGGSAGAGGVQPVGPGRIPVGTVWGALAVNSGWRALAGRWLGAPLTKTVQSRRPERLVYSKVDIFRHGASPLCCAVICRSLLRHRVSLRRLYNCKTPNESRRCYSENPYLRRCLTPPRIIHPYCLDA